MARFLEFIQIITAIDKQNQPTSFICGFTEVTKYIWGLLFMCSADILAIYIRFMHSVMIWFRDELVTLSMQFYMLLYVSRRYVEIYVRSLNPLACNDMFLSTRYSFHDSTF